MDQKIIFHVGIYDSQTRKTSIIKTIPPSASSLNTALVLKDLVERILNITNAPRSFSAYYQPEEVVK